MTAVTRRSAQKKIKAGSFSLNRFGTGTQSVFHIVLGLFALLCIIPFIFVIIIAFSSEESIRQVGYSFTPLSWSTQAFDYTFKLVFVYSSHIVILLIGFSLLCAKLYKL